MSATSFPRVLLAEDDAEMRWLVARALRKDGFVVAEVADGERLFAEIERHVLSEQSRIDLIVTDVRMPGRSGLEVVELLRAASMGVPLIVMTAFGDDETRQRAIAAGAIMFDKPFHLDDLRAVARRLAAPRAP